VFGINTHFDATSALALGSGVTVSALTAASATELRATVTVADDPRIAGFHDVRVTTGGEVATEDVPGPLLVVRGLAADIPRLTDVSPAEGPPGAALTLSVTGENTHFADTSAAEFFPGGVRVVAIRATGPTAAELDVEIDGDTTLGARDLAIVTGGETASGLGLFAVRGTAVAGCSAASDCDDAEPCTENRCVDGRCQFPAVTGIATVRCAFARPLAPPECEGASIPKAVINKFTAAGRLVERAAEATTARQARNLLRKARRPLRASIRAVGKAEHRRRRPLPAACATVLRAVLGFAQGRLAEFRL
jgi:hypothetical protein